MSNRYLTHLSTVLFLHLLILIGTFNLIQERRSAAQPLSLGPAVIKLQLATQVLMEKTLPKMVPKMARAPKPEKVMVSPVPAAPVAAAPGKVESALSKMAREDLRALYKAELRAEIEKYKSYPPMSRRLGQSGTVVVAFTLLEDGHIIDVRLETPSRFERLNEAALTAVKSVHKFKPIPNEMGEDKMEIIVPVNFLAI